jgi:predicted Zn-dependent protease
MMTPELRQRARSKLPLWFRLGFCLVFPSCSIQPQILSLQDDRGQELLRTEAAAIIEVSEDRDNFSKYQFFLAEFPRQDILGLSVGNGRIYISYSLASRALTDSNHRWLLRQTLAHEIAHESAGHANRGGVMWFNRITFARGASGRDLGLPWYVRFRNYSVDKELEADLKGLSYWNKLGWDCQIWVRILENFQKQNYSGDSFHPTDRRLQQAQTVCQHQAGEPPRAGNGLPMEDRSSRSVN